MDRRSLGRESRTGPAVRPPPRRPSPPATPYRADAFALSLAPGWSDATLVTLAGPVVDGRSHQITVVTADHDGRPLADLADDQVRVVLETLPGGAVLLRDRIALDGGGPAERVVFRWAPVPGQVLYQQHVVAVVGGRSVTMAASFTARSRRTVGPDVDRMMRSLAPPPSNADLAGHSPRSGPSGAYRPHRRPDR